MKKYIAIFVVIIISITAGVYYFLLNKSDDAPTSTSYMVEGQLLLDQKQYSKALEQFKLAINSQPSNTDAYLKASNILQLKGNKAAAIEILQNGESVAAKPYKLQYEIGKILFEKNDLQGSLKYLEEANANNPNDWKTSVELVKVYSYFEEKKEKTEEVLQKTDVSDGEGRAWINYYLAVLKASDSIGEAIGYLEEVSGVENADLNERINNFLKILRSLQTDDQEVIQKNTMIAYEMIRAELYPLAIPMLNKVVEENDEYYAAYMYLGVCNIKMEDFDKAQNNLEQATNIDESQVQPWIFLAQVYAQRGNQKEAISTYEKALDIDQDSEVIRYDYAKTLVEFELYQQARLQYLDLIKLESAQKIEYKVELAFLGVEYLQKYEEAKSLASEVVEDWEGFSVAPSELRAEALDVLGWTLAKTDQKDLAISYISQALEADEFYPRAYYHLGEIYADLGKYSEAKTHLQRAVDLDLNGDVSQKAQNKLDNLAQEDE